MKIGNGPDPSLLERMKAAHTESVQAADTAAAEGAGGASTPTGTSQAAPSSKAPAPTGLKREALVIARDVVAGKFGSDDEVRMRILDAIVDTRFGDGLDRSERKRASKLLSVTLAQDPKFKAEIDEMLVLASRELHTLSDG
jgi:hypothetical protein